MRAAGSRGKRWDAVGGVRHSTDTAQVQAISPQPGRLFSSHVPRFSLFFAFLLTTVYMHSAPSPAPLQGDGFAGYPDWAPFDAIHVGAAAPAVPPALVSQLAAGGRLVVPVGPEGGPQVGGGRGRGDAGRASGWGEGRLWGVGMGWAGFWVTAARTARAESLV